MCGRDWSSDVCSSDLNFMSPYDVTSIIRSPSSSSKNDTRNNETPSKPFQRKRIIYSATDSYWNMAGLLSSFSQCQYNNCEGRIGVPLTKMADGDIIMFQFNKIRSFPNYSPDVRRRQYWLVYGAESPAFRYNRWSKSLDENINATMTYRHQSNIFIPYGTAVKVKNDQPVGNSNTALTKTKGALVYISNCQSVGYNRLETVKQLQKYLDVDLYGGCGTKPPCAKGDSKCEAKLHSQYRFYLSFENSMCSEYITEKFWSRLASPSMFVPVALGGLSVEEYSRVAPPRSFIHAYNFTSIEELGEYLKHLTEDDTAYNRYHEWRSERSEEHTSELQSSPHISYAVFCLKKKTLRLTDN